MSRTVFVRSGSSRFGQSISVGPHVLPADEPSDYGRCLTLEDTVEFFNLVLALKLSKEAKQDLVSFMRQL
jgi:hypothetical protein